jgi:hypothetical protein
LEISVEVAIITIGTVLQISRSSQKCNFSPVDGAEKLDFGFAPVA